MATFLNDFGTRDLLIRKSERPASPSLLSRNRILNAASNVP